MSTNNNKDNNDNKNNVSKKYNRTDLELLIHKLQIETTKKNIEISRHNKELQQYKKSTKDSSNNFPSPEEFKIGWETLIKISAMDAFENISLNHILLMKTINVILNLLYEISSKKIREKINDILQCLGLTEKKEENIKKFFEKFKKLIFQDYFSSIFKINNDENFVKEVIKDIKNEIKKNEKIFSNEDKINIMKDLDSKSFKKFIIELYYLCLYMNINEPKLIIKTSTEISYKYYNKNIYSNIEGFSNENDICLLILNPPITKNNINYKGIKPTVCIIENHSKEIKDLCEKQNKNNKDNNFYSTSDCKCFNNFKNKEFDNGFEIFERDTGKNIKNKKIDNKANNSKVTQDDFDYKYKINIDKIQNKLCEKKCKSYKSSFLNINHNKFRIIYKELKLSKNDSISILTKIKGINKINKNPTRNISFLSVHEAQNKIPKNKNNNNRNYRSNKSSSPISPRKSPSFMEKDKNKNKIKKLINTINNRCQQKFKNYKSEKIINRNKKVINKENNNIKIINIKNFREFNSYICKRNNKSNKGDKAKTEYDDKFEDNKVNEKNKKNKNKISIKINNKINKLETNIFTAPCSGTPSRVEEIKSIKKYAQIPNKNKMKKIGNILSNQYNNSCCNTNSNLMVSNNNNNYKTSNNSMISNYNNEKKKELKIISNSTSSKKVEKKKKNYLSNSNGIKIKRKKFILNINNNIEKKYEKIIKMKSKNKNKYISNDNLFNKESNQDIRYYSIISSKSQINIYSKTNKNNLQKKYILLYKRNINETHTNNKKENEYKIKLNTEKNQEKNLFIESLRNQNKGGFERKYKKINNKNIKKYCNLLSDNKENKNNINVNTKENLRNNIDKNERNITYENIKKEKRFANKKYYLNGLLSFNDKKLVNKK